MSGRGSVRVANDAGVMETAAIRAGDARPIQLNQPHAFENTADEPLEIMIIGVWRDSSHEDLTPLMCGMCAGNEREGCHGTPSLNGGPGCAAPSNRSLSSEKRSSSRSSVARADRPRHVALGQALSQSCSYQAVGPPPTSAVALKMVGTQALRTCSREPRHIRRYGLTTCIPVPPSFPQGRGDI